MKKLLYLFLLLFSLYHNFGLADDNNATFNFATKAYKLTSAQIERAVDEVLDLLQSGENFDYIGESVSQLEHALQCAQLARNDGADEETIIAALLHDIGHLSLHKDADSMGGYGKKSHEKIGAEYVLKHGFSQKISELIDGHVQAKRYLTYKDPQYLQKLSQASLQTLVYQGGPMSAQEAELFEKDPLFKQKLQMRLWDEAAKVVGASVASLEVYRNMLFEQLK